MRRRRGPGLGSGLLVGGLVLLGLAVAVGGYSGEVAVLVPLFFVPEIVALIGAVLLSAALARRIVADSPTRTFARIVGLAITIGAALGLAILVAWTVALVPGWAQGQVGYLGAGFGVGIVAVLGPVAGMSLGLAVGLVIAIVWWFARGQHRQTERA